MTKPFTPKPGDKWTRDEDGMLWVYRKDCAVVFSRTGFTAGPVTCRSAHETDLLAPVAHAQLREWGYEVSGDEKPITEARVREIVAQMLAAQPTPAEVREAIAIANDPNTKWHNITTKIVDPKEAVAPEPDWKGLLGELEDSIGDVMKRGTFVPSVTLAELNIVLVRLNNALAAAWKELRK